MTKSSVPKLNIGSKIRPRPTKAAASGSGGKTSYWVVFGVLVVLGALIGILVWAISRNKDDKKSPKNKNSIKDDKRISKNVDSEKDTEGPSVKPSKLITHVDKQKAPETSLKTPSHDDSFAEKPSADQAASALDKQFQMYTTEDAKEPTAPAIPKTHRDTVKTSQLGRDSVLPEFSVEKQPSRQVGMAYDMVYNALRDEGAQKSKPSVSSAQVPFGGSEFQEMIRQKQTAG